MQRNRYLAKVLCIGALLWTTSIGHAAEADPAPAPAPAPIVYVSDFELDAASVTPDNNVVNRQRTRARNLLSRHGLAGTDSRNDPQAQANQIVSAMSSALIADLKKAGIDARRLSAASDQASALPATGWLVRGTFLSVNEGDRVRRAVVGFGRGQGSLQVAVAVNDLSAGSVPPIYQTVEADSGSHLPGAVVVLNPYVAIAKFVLAGNDKDKMIAGAAQQIADSVIKQVQPHSETPASP